VGIVHRDLKPGNVMLTKSGVKLLDFGLARFLPPGGGERGAGAGAADPLTTEGAIVGTVPYMSPEQLRGEAADARSDIFAFGAVLYEMITGARAFAANSQAELAAAILEHDPPAITTCQPLAPPALDRVVATCLAKHPEDRWPRARDVLRELKWIRDDGDRRPPPVAARASRRNRWLAGAGVAAGVAIAVLATVMWPRESAAPAPPPRVSFTIEPPKGTTFPRASAQIAISPDATRLVFVALSTDGTSRLWIRRLDATESRLIAGTDGAQYPFWSPDSRSLAFFIHGEKLVRVDADGGARQELSDVFMPQGGAWAGDQILFSSNGTLHRMTTTGGVVTPVTTLDASRKERRHAWPAFLPDGRRFLYASLPAEDGQPAIYQGTLDSTSTERVLTGSTSFVLAGTRLLSVNNRSLVVQTLDAERARVSGEPTTLASGVGVDVRGANGGFAASGGRVLAYRVVGDHSRLQWFDRQGRPETAFQQTADYQHPWLAPDETHVTIEKTDPSTRRHGVWILDVPRDITTRLLVDPSGAHVPVWSPDGRRIVFGSNRLGGNDLYAMSADGTGEQTLVLESPHHFILQPTDWSTDQRFIVYTEYNRRGDIWILPMVPPGQMPQVFLNTNANELQAASLQMVSG
jgi:Tol biopolymer transport system component